MGDFPSPFPIEKSFPVARKFIAKLRKGLKDAHTYKYLRKQDKPGGFPGGTSGQRTYLPNTGDV